MTTLGGGSEECSDHFDLDAPELSSSSSADSAVRGCNVSNIYNGRTARAARSPGKHDHVASGFQREGGREGEQERRLLQQGQKADLELASVRCSNTAGEGQSVRMAEVGNETETARMEAGEEEEEEHVCDWLEWVCQVCGKTPFVWR